MLKEELKRLVRAEIARLEELPEHSDTIDRYIDHLVNLLIRIDRGKVMLS